MAESFKLPDGLTFAAGTRVKATGDIREKINLYKLLYSASHDDREDIYDAYMKRHYAKPDEAKEKVLLPTWFVFQNLIQDVIDKKIAAIPANPDFSTDETLEIQFGAEGETPTVSTWINDVLESRIWGDSRTFFESQEDFNTYLKVEGNNFFKLTKTDGQIEISRMETTDVRILFDAENLNIIHGYLFEWEETFFDETGKEQNVKVKEAITRDAYLRWENEEPVNDEGFGPHEFPFIPVVHMKNRHIKGSPLGGSDIEPLIEPQFQYLEVKIDIRTNNRFLGRPSFKAKGLIGDFVAGPWTIAHLAPTGESDIVRITGDEDVTPLENELERVEDFIYRVGRVMRKNVGDNKALSMFTSARALLTLDREGVRDLARLLPRLQSGYSELIGMALYMLHPEVVAFVQSLTAEIEVEDPVKELILAFQKFVGMLNVTYPNLDIENIELVADKVRTLVLLNEKDPPLISDTALLKQLQRLGYVPSDENVDNLVKEAGGGAGQGDGGNGLEERVINQGNAEGEVNESGT